VLFVSLWLYSLKMDRKSEIIETGLFNSRSIRLLLPLVFYALFTYILIDMSLTLLPGAFNTDSYKITFHWPPSEEPTLRTSLKTYDGEHYLFLSRYGYIRGSSSNAFYPLWPFLIRVFSYVTGGDHLIAGLILAGLFSIAGMILFHHFVLGRHGEKTADLALLFLLAFPGSIFFSFVYTESLFFFLSILLFTFLYRKEYLKAGLVSFFLPLTRAVGLFAIIPLALYIYLNQGRSRKLLYSLFPIAGLVLYFLTLYLFTGDPFEGFKAQQFYPARANLFKVLHPINFIKLLFAPLKIHGILDSAIDRFWFIYFLCSLWPLWKKDRCYFAFALPLGIVPAMTISFMSFTRFALVIFPLFIITADRFIKEDRKYWLYAVLFVLFSIKILFLILHVNYQWVG
jgi:hypothetical protein